MPPVPERHTAWQHLRALPGLLRSVYPGVQPQAMLARAWLLGQTLGRFGLHRRLMDAMTHPPFAAMFARHPRLLRKLHLTYPCRGLGAAQRLDWLLGHSRATLTLLGPRLAEQVWLSDHAVSCRVNLPQGHGQLPVLLRMAHRKHMREGDLTLELLDPFGTKLYALTFSFQPTPPGPELLIGAMQGQMPLALTKHITKLSLGLRPPNLLLIVLQALACHLGVVRLRACGRSRHIHHGSDRAERVQFDYDGFWASVGGVADGQGFFELPVQPARRSHDETPSHKRSQYRRRYAWMDELHADVGRWLVEQGAPGVTAPRD